MLIFKIKKKIFIKTFNPYSIKIYKRAKEWIVDAVLALDPKTLSLKCISVFLSVVCCVFIFLVPSTAIENKDFKTEENYGLFSYPLLILSLRAIFLKTKMMIFF